MALGVVSQKAQFHMMVHSASVDLREEGIDK
jgi:hypothetical protein